MFSFLSLSCSMAWMLTVLSDAQDARNRAVANDQRCSLVLVSSQAGRISLRGKLNLNGQFRTHILFEHLALLSVFYFTESYSTPSAFLVLTYATTLRVPYGGSIAACSHMPLPPQRLPSCLACTLLYRVSRIDGCSPSCSHKCRHHPCAGTFACHAH
jgi:hypothetical protein